MSLDWWDFRNIFEIAWKLSKTNEDVNYIAEWMMKKISYLQNFGPWIILKIAEKIKAEQYCKGEVIIWEGDDGDRVYFLVSGEIEIVKNGKKVFS